MRLLISAFPTGEHDLVIIGGGVAGYVAAIKAGQEGLKVRTNLPSAYRSQLGPSRRCKILTPDTLTDRVY